MKEIGASAEYLDAPYYYSATSVGRSTGLITNVEIRMSKEFPNIECRNDEMSVLRYSLKGNYFGLRALVIGHSFVIRH